MTEKIIKLMIPGPVQPEDDVLEAIGKPVRAHYGPEWRDYYNSTTDLLKNVFNTSGDVHILVGSGSSAIDACLGSMLSKGEKILIGVNGFFGERSFAIAKSYGLKTVSVNRSWGEPLSGEDFKKAFQIHPDARAVAIVHLETSTTIVNPIAEIADVARMHNAACFVDAVSSIGGLPFHMDDWGIDFCATSSQKCLGAPPGLAPVAIGSRGWEFVDRNPNKDHGWYLNLRIWRQYSQEWADWHPFPITMATNNVVALKTSLENLLEEGLDKRLLRYKKLALRLREGLRQLDMKPFTPDEMMAPVLTAAYGVKGVPTSRIVDFLSENYGIRIAGGLGALKDKIFRIGHMSPAVIEDDIDQVLFALSEFKRSTHSGV